MKRNSHWVRRVVLLLTICITPGGATTTRAAPGIDPYIKMRWPVAGRLAPDGALYFIYNPDGINQLYKASTGGTQKDAASSGTFIFSTPRRAKSIRCS
ncbi:MAG: hypothetical protein HYR83_10970 [Planctomycetes bacterium]|nr:hypothetical protein [Planctomycetota bacterium]